MIIKCSSIINGKPLFDGKLDDLLDECIPGGALQVLTPLEYITRQQCAWFKGVLLPKLAENGDSVECWETRLKLEVMPDEFVPEIITVRGKEYTRIPSITKLGKKKMNQLIEGSVAKCHEWGLTWVVLPDEELRK